MNVSDSNYDANLSKKIKERQQKIVIELVDKLSSD